MTAVHLRTQIRDAAASTLGNLATTGARVHKAYMRPLDDASLPCLLIKLEGQEDIEPSSIGTILDREMDLVVTGFAKATGDVDATLNEIALEVENALAAVPTLGGKCTDCLLTKIQTDVDLETDKPVGRIDLTYRVSYFTNAGAPGTLL